MKKTIDMGRKIITFLSVFSILAVSIFSALIGVDFTTKAETPADVEVWGGYDDTKLAVTFTDGDGSAVDPYIITNGDQLYRMVYDSGKSANGEPTYYKLGADIYLNDITDYDKWGSDGFDMTTLNNWYENESLIHRTFYGTFDGDGHYVYGLYISGYMKASFFASPGLGACIKNTHFRNAHIVNTSGEHAEDNEDTSDYNNAAKGSAGVIFSYAAGDSNNSTVDLTIANCSVIDCYVEAAYYVSGLIAYADGLVPNIKNCIVADIELNATNEQKGVAGAVINETWGAQNVATVEGVISIGNPFYGVTRDGCWNGYKVPLVSYKYLFKDCYSDASHTFEWKHATHGDLTFTDSEINVVKSGYLVGERAAEELDLDWEHNWSVVDGDYPMPQNEYIVPTGEQYYANGGPASSEDVWNGKTAKTFAAGTGTADDPYLIENCEQFYKMVSTLNANEYYKIADGVTALYFNDVKGLSYSETMNVIKSNKMHTYAPGEENNFSGYFDGNGVTIYGVKATGSARSGLFPQAGNATIKNVTIKNSYFTASKSDADGAAAVVGDLATGGTVNVRNTAVVDCYVHSGTNAAGIVACSHIGGCVFIDDCIVSGGEILATTDTTTVTPLYGAFVASSSSGSHTIKNSISLGIFPASENDKSYGSTFKNVYTDVEAPSALVSEGAVGVKVVKTNELKGTAVQTTAAEFDWNEAWRASTGIPMPRKHVSVLGTVGQPWSGKIADSYAGGDGTVNNPYQIDTPEKLAQMLMYCKADAYYKLTAHIYINDVSSSNWKNSAKQWLTSVDVSGFTGIFDANGYTVYGLYNADVASGVYAGLIPVLGSGGELRNVKVDSAYLSGKAGAYLGAVVGTVEDNATNITVLRAAEVGKNVELTGAANAGGIVGRVGFTRLRMDNSVFAGTLSATGKKGGLVGEVTGKLDIKQSVSVGAYPFASAENVTASDIYTDAQGSVQGVTVLDSANMIGENAKTYMTELDFTDIWSTTDSYPVPVYTVKSFDGVQGEVWTGEIATNFAKYPDGSDGNGTAEKPYLIATGEQLALAISQNNNNGNLHYKMICDIYLNDTSSELWTAKVGCNSWLHNSEAGTFTGTFDGDGYVVFGMYYNYKSTPTNSYLGLFPRVGGSATIKNVGVSQAYIKAALGDESVYAGGLFGMGSAFYDFYGKKTGPAETVNDEFLVPGDETPTKLPSFTNCFVDQSCYIEANSVSGIGCPGGAVIVIRDCYVTATIKGNTDTRAGALMGNAWANGSRIYNSLALTQNDAKSLVGNHQWVEDEASICTYIENVYYYGSKYLFGTTRVTRPQWRVGEEAKTAMPNLDWENTWRVEPDGTPVLRIFDKDGRSAGLFSDKTYNIPDVQINFMTGTSEVEVPSLVGKPYEKVTLPTPTRPGYIFTGWYSFPDYTLEYPYEYFLSRDINLYAGWEKNGIIQGFESYTYSLYDCDTTRWNYNKPGSRTGYMVEYIHSGTKSMQLLDNSSESADLLLNYEEWLTIDQDYTITFWVATDKEGNPATTLSLVQNNHPDYLGTEVSVDPMVTVTGLQVGQWKQYSYNFTAKTNWVSIRATGNSSLFIDDVVIAPKGSIIIDNNNFVNGDVSNVSPNTNDNATVAALIAAIVACATVALISKKNLVEVIDNT